MTHSQRTHHQMHRLITVLYVMVLCMAFGRGGVGMAVYTACAVVVAYITFRLQDGV